MVASLGNAVPKVCWRRPVVGAERTLFARAATRSETSMSFSKSTRTGDESLARDVAGHVNVDRTATRPRFAAGLSDLVLAQGRARKVSPMEVEGRHIEQSSCRLRECAQVDALVEAGGVLGHALLTLVVIAPGSRAIRIVCISGKTSRRALCVCAAPRVVSRCVSGRGLRWPHATSAPLAPR